jgi:hypothetical protein
VPTIPDPAGTQQQAIAGNLGNLPGLTGLTGQLNQFTAGQAALPYQLNLPNYSAMTGASSGNILSKLQGQIPADVAAQISQMAAERGVSTGSIGSPNANTALLRSLGLTSLDLQNQGEQQLTSAVGRTPTGYQFNPAQFLVSPGEQQGAQYAANVLGAAPDPAAAAAAGLKAARSGLDFGLGTGGGAHQIGGGGGTDALGFPNTNFMQGGFAPGEVSGGALGYSAPPETPAQQMNAWQNWWQQGSQGPMTGGATAQPWQTGVNANQSGYQPWTGTDLFSNFDELFDQGTDQGFETGMASGGGVYGGDLFGDGYGG